MEVKKQAKKWQNSISARLIVIGILILLFLIPISMIKDLVYERQMRKDDAFTEVSSKWGNPQSITGPFVSIPYWEYSKNKDKKTGKIEIVRFKKQAYFLPEKLDIKGDIVPELRHRGIFEVVVYTTHLNISGKFDKLDLEQWKIDPKNILWDEARIFMGVTDLRSIKENVNIQIQDSAIAFNPGIDREGLIASGIEAKIKWDNDKSSNFTLDLKLNGSSYLYFDPLGKETNVELSSNWSSPKFDGRFLPDSSTVNPSGFKANWKVLHLNRKFPQSFTGNTYNITNASFGVELIKPVDEYQKNMRAGKYAILILALTFVTFFFVQVLNRLQIHPIQYIIVGLALMLFYTLLIAISEQLSFNWAYFIATVAIIGMIGLYVKAVLKNTQIASILSGLLLFLYGFIFTIIQLQDYSLLIGSIGLFIILAIIMYLSKDVDWYDIDFEKVKTISNNIVQNNEEIK